jgi:hypothetical protein
MPSFSASSQRLNGCGAENDCRMLTERNRVPRVGLLNHELACRNFLGIVLRPMRNEAEVCLFRMADERLRVSFNSSGFSVSDLLCPNTAQEPSQPGKLQGLRAVVMTKRNKRAQAAIPHQVVRNLKHLAWFSSPRGTTCKTKIRRETKHTRRISHGSARTFEDL